jgi:hypothetical protein
MKISLAKHGGQAAGTFLGRPPRVLDTDTLPPPVTDELARLVEAAKVTPAAREGGSGRAPDAMSYTIMVEDGGQQTTLKQSDTNESPAFAALRTSLERHMK